MCARTGGRQTSAAAPGLAGAHLTGKCIGRVRLLSPSRSPNTGARYNGANLLASALPALVRANTRTLASICSPAARSAPSGRAGRAARAHFKAAPSRRRAPPAAQLTRARDVSWPPDDSGGRAGARGRTSGGPNCPNCPHQRPGGRDFGARPADKLIRAGARHDYSQRGAPTPGD